MSEHHSTHQKMKWENTPFKNPMARARGLGSSRSGVQDWLMQKFTAIANIGLSLWLVCALVNGNAASIDAVQAFLQSPVNAALLIIFVASSFYHAMLGLVVVVEDYFHGERAKVIALLIVKMGLIGLGVTAVVSILKLAI